MCGMTRTAYLMMNLMWTKWHSK